MRTPAALAMTSVLLIGACSTSGPTLPSDSPVNLQVSTDLDAYPQGGLAVITLKNEDTMLLHYNPCHGVMEDLHENAWRTAPVNELEVTLCSAIALEIKPGETVHHDYHLDPFHGPGTYRLRIAAVSLRDGASIVIRSNAFRID